MFGVGLARGTGAGDGVCGGGVKAGKAETETPRQAA